MTDIINIHDKFVKERLSQRENAIDFLKNYLPAELLEIVDLTGIKIEKDSFVTEELKEYFTDLLYKVDIKGNESYVYVLFEHKSYPDKYVSLQILEYILKCWKVKKKGNKKLPVVLPLVIYHGKKNWKYGNRLSEIVSKEDVRLQKYIPDFEYILYDICRYEDEEITGIEEMKLFMQLLKYGGLDKLEEELEKILELLKYLMNDRDKFTSYIIYIMKIIEIEPKKLAKMVSEKVSKEGGELIMTTAQILINEGMEIGIIEGEIRGLLEGIELALDIKFGEEGLARMERIREIRDIKKLETVKERIRKASKIEDVEEVLYRN